MESFIVAIAAGAVALLFAGITTLRVLKTEQGNERMQAIGAAIRQGAGAFLRREYMTLLPFALVVTIVLGVLDYTVFTHDLAAPATRDFLRGRHHLFGIGRVRRDERCGAGQRADRCGGADGPEPRPPRGLLQRLGNGHNRGRHRATGRHHPVPGLPEHQRRGRLRLWSQLHSPLRSRGRRHLHQGRRRGLRPCGQGRSGHP